LRSWGGCGLDHGRVCHMVFLFLVFPFKRKQETSRRLGRESTDSMGNSPGIGPAEEDQNGAKAIVLIGPLTEGSGKYSPPKRFRYRRELSK
jgi:hypothetical protein